MNVARDKKNTYSSIIAPLTFSELHLFCVGVKSESLCRHSSISPCVLAPKVYVHEYTQNHAHGDRSDEESMSGEVTWRILSTEGKASNNTAKVTETDVHGNTDSPLSGSTNIISVPGDSHGNIRVDSSREYCENKGKDDKKIIITQRQRGKCLRIERGSSG